MARTVPSTEPVSATAGDFLTWTHTSPDFTSSTTTLSYQIIGPDKLDPALITVTADGDGWLIEIPTSATENLTGGSYAVSRVYTTGTDRQTDTLPRLTLRRNPTLVTSTKSEAETERELVNAAILAFASGGGVKSYMIGNRQVVREDVADLLTWRDRLDRVIASERRTANGGGFGTKIAYRMKAPC